MRSAVLRPSRRRLLAAACSVLALHAATLLASPPAQAATPAPIAAWGSAVTGTLGLNAANFTCRNVGRVTLAGPSIRIHLSNAFNDTPTTFGAVRAGVHSGNGAVPSSSAVTFGGMSSVQIPAQGEVTSDPVPIAVSAGTEIAVSVFVPGSITRFTYHEMGGATNYCTSFDGSAGNQTTAPATTSWPVRGASVSWLNGIDVARSTSEKAIVTLGDSLTDGFPVQVNDYRRYPDRLSARLQGTPAGSRLSVVNMGISGNTITGGGVGPSAMARFDHDVLGQAGVRHLVLFEGTNDITLGASAQSVIAGLTQLLDRAHASNIAVTLATITPRHSGCGQPNDSIDTTIETVNTWIRRTTLAESKVDFNAAVRDPSSPNCILAAYDSGDHLHFSSAGNQALADAFNLRIFTANTGQVSAPGGLCLDLPGGTSVNGTRAQLWECLQNSPQSWTVPGEGTVRAYGKCLDINGNASAPGTPVQLWTCNGLGGQRWTQQANGELRNPQSGLCLDVPDGNAVAGQGLRIWPCNGSGAQQFRLPTTAV